MFRASRCLLLLLLLSLGVLAAIADVPAANAAADAKPADGWIVLFDGKTLDGWKAGDHPESWSVKNGLLVGDGPRSWLFSTKQEFTDLEFKADIRLSHHGDSGLFFRAKLAAGWPQGYEAQANNSGADPKRTGSLYNFVTVKEQRVADNTWWTEHVIARGKHITIQVNGRTLVDFDDDKQTYRTGLVALQQHHQGSVVQFKNLLVRPLDEKQK